MNTDTYLRDHLANIYRWAHPESEPQLANMLGFPVLIPEGKRYANGYTVSALCANHRTMEVRRAYDGGLLGVHPQAVLGGTTADIFAGINRPGLALPPCWLLDMYDVLRRKVGTGAGMWNAKHGQPYVAIDLASGDTLHVWCKGAEEGPHAVPTSYEARVTRANGEKVCHDHGATACEAACRTLSAYYAMRAA